LMQKISGAQVAAGKPFFGTIDGLGLNQIAGGREAIGRERKEVEKKRGMSIECLWGVGS